MKLKIIIITLLLSQQIIAQSYEKIHFNAIVIDTHNDIPTTAIEKGVSFDADLKTKTHSDLQRMQQGGVDAQFFSIWCDGLKQNPYAWANREMDTVMAWVNRNPSKMMLATSVNDIKEAAKKKS
jgi:membrane dipeptidase